MKAGRICKVCGHYLHEGNVCLIMEGGNRCNCNGDPIGKKLEPVIKYDPVSDLVTIEGVRFSMKFFRSLQNKTEDGKCLRVLSNDDGFVTMEIRDHA